MKVRRQPFPRIGSICVFNPSILDQLDPPSNIAKNDVVRVVAGQISPKGVIGMGYVERVDTGDYVGLVSAASLEKIS